MDRHTPTGGRKEGRTYNNTSTDGTETEVDDRGKRTAMGATVGGMVTTRNRFLLSASLTLASRPA